MTRSKTDNTVFVRFVPPSSEITRFHLEDHFGQVGPIKKCSVISNKESALGYGFVKFVSQEDAQAATEQSGKQMQVNGKSYKLTVELASDQHKKQPSTKDERKKETPTTASVPEHDPNDDIMVRRKRTSRVIVRNLSFYANEANVKRILEQEFGPIMDIHLPKVKDGLHRGFCFVTFQNPRDAQKATQARISPLFIKKRPVAIDFSTPKVVHQRMKQEQKEQHEEEENSEQQDQDEKDGDSHSDSSDDSESTSDEDVESESGDSDSDESDEEENENDSVTSDNDKKDDTAHDTKCVSEGCTLFLRNLPFDATRHDVFELFSRFGYITSVYLVKDKETGVAKGTAFLTFKHPSSAQKALEASGKAEGSAFVTQRHSMDDCLLLYLRGRRILCDLAVDKQTAATITKEKESHTGKDRRNLYLKQEGRVANLADGSMASVAWENLPETDQLKRQRAFADKNTKLKSPLFFINPHRLSIRNLAKHVNEAQLKQLCVKAITRGLQQGLVTKDDIVAHWKASGEVSTRDIMTRIQQDSDQIIPPFDAQNVKLFIPSVYIDRDFAPNKKDAPSRGFGFVEFHHHAHALAALRELNNNPMYSSEYCTGGKKAAEQKKKSSNSKRSKTKSGDFVGEDGRVRIPRLIVEFTVENKAKAKKQAEHRAQQQANVEKQKLEQLEKKQADGGGTKQKKKSRGKIQRERKRKQLEEGTDKDKELPKPKPGNKKPTDESGPVAKKPKTIKPPKKHKVNKEEQEFEKMVRTYKAAFAGVSERDKTNGAAEPKPSRAEVAKKRWFD